MLSHTYFMHLPWTLQYPCGLLTRCRGKQKTVNDKRNYHDCKEDTDDDASDCSTIQAAIGVPVVICDGFRTDGITASAAQICGAVVEGTLLHGGSELGLQLLRGGRQDDGFRR